MGYIAYAVGTLIVAAVVHSVYNSKKITFAIRSNQKAETAIDATTWSVSELADVATEEGSQDTFRAPVTIRISQDEPEDSPTSSGRDESPPQTSRRRKLKTERQSPSRREEGEGQSDSVPATSPSSAALSRVQSREMAPPPRPPSASSLDSATPSQARQRALMPPPSSLPPSRNRSPPRLQPSTTSSSLAPPSRGTLPSQRQGGFARPTGFSNSLAPPPSAASAARTPAGAQATSSSSLLSVTQQRVLQNTRMQPSPSLLPTSSTQHPTSRPSKKIILSPGHSPLDWAALTRSTSPTAPLTLRGPNASSLLGPHRLGRITPSQLSKQTGRKGKDAWTSYQGRVYNISAYLPFHPGGEPELMKGAGRSSDGLFAEVHPWVNFEAMLGNCLVGIMVGEDDPGALGQNEVKAENGLDEMD